MLELTVMHWVVFCVAVAVLLTLDLTVFHRHSHEPTLRESAWWTLFWCGLALSFNGLIWYAFDRDHALQFLNGYIVEWTLSMDNVFVFLVIFSYFHVPLKYQYRVLFWGILGAIFMRLTFILAAGKLLEHFHWVIYIFGAFLLYTGVKLLSHGDSPTDPEKTIVMRLARRFLRISSSTHGHKFVVRENGLLCATPLLLVLLVVESTDVVFAVDSVPAIFGVVEEGPARTFLVFTSNVFAIMGLRALYFLLAGVMDMFHYLSIGLSAVLIFIGTKMLVVGTDIPIVGVLVPKEWLPNWASLLVIITLLGTSIIASVVTTPHRPPDAPVDDEADA